MPTLSLYPLSKKHGFAAQKKLEKNKLLLNAIYEFMAMSIKHNCSFLSRRHSFRGDGWRTDGVVVLATDGSSHAYDATIPSDIFRVKSHSHQSSLSSTDKRRLARLARRKRRSRFGVWRLSLPFPLMNQYFFLHLDLIKIGTR